MVASIKDGAALLKKQRKKNAEDLAEHRRVSKLSPAEKILDAQGKDRARSAIRRAERKPKNAPWDAVARSIEAADNKRLRALRRVADKERHAELAAAGFSSDVPVKKIRCRRCRGMVPESGFSAGTLLAVHAMPICLNCERGDR